MVAAQRVSSVAGLVYTGNPSGQNPDKLDPSQSSWRRCSKAVSEINSFPLILLSATLKHSFQSLLISTSSHFHHHAGLRTWGSVHLSFRFFLKHLGNCLWKSDPQNRRGNQQSLQGNPFPAIPLSPSVHLLLCLSIPCYILSHFTYHVFVTTHGNNTALPSYSPYHHIPAPCPSACCPRLQCRWQQLESNPFPIVQPPVQYFSASIHA
jgi:hypothetical protein